MNALEDQSWRERSSCHPLFLRGVVTVDDFFPEGRFVTNSPEYHEHVDGIKAICATCPVTAECLEFARLTHQDEGIWGGLTKPDRVRKKYGRRKRVNGKLTYVKEDKAS